MNNESADPPVWVKPELLEKTIRVWSKYLGREVSRNEALEMLKGIRGLIQVARKFEHRTD